MFFSDEIDAPEEKFKLITYDLLRQKEKEKYVQSKSQLMMFAHLTEQGVQIHSKPKQMPFVEPKIVKSFEFQEIEKVKAMKKNKLYAMAFFDDSDKMFFAMKFEKQPDCDEYYSKLNEGLQMDKKAKNKSEFNYLPIEQNLRKIVEKIIIKSRHKWQLYKQLIGKLKARSKNLNAMQNKMIIMGLVNNEHQMQIALRKQKIQAYDIEKKQYITDLKEEVNKFGGKKGQKSFQLDVEQPLQIEGYTQKRRKDGLVRLNNEQIQQDLEIQIQKRFQDALCLDKIPNYSEFEIDNILNNHVEEMDIEEPKKKQQNVQKIKGEKMKIPTKNYSIMCKQQIKEERKKIKQTDLVDQKAIKIVEAVKLFYQLMKRNTQEVQKSNNNNDKTGPMSEVLEELKNILTELEKQYERQKPNNKFIPEFIRQASNNYLQYKRFKFKFYQ